MGLFIETGADRFPPGALQQLATVQNPSTTNALMTMWYDLSQVNDATPRFKPGSVWQDDATGNYFQYVKCNAGLAIGQLVTQATPGTDTVSSVSANYDTVTLTTGGLTAGAETNNYAYFNSGTTGGTPYNGQLRLIKANTASILTVSLKGSIYGNNQYDPDLINSNSVALANGSNVSIIRPYTVAVSTASTVPIGVALATTTSTYYTVIQLTGLAMCLGVGTGTAIAVNQVCCPGASGTVTGPTAGQLFFSGASSIISMYASSGASSLMPFLVNFRGV
jgi:hypothetical protein